MQLLTPEKGGSKSDGWIDKDTTSQSYLVSFPSDLSCEGCTVRPSTLNTRASGLDQPILISESALLFKGPASKLGSTVRPRDTRPQAARTLTMHVFE